MRLLLIVTFLFLQAEVMAAPGTIVPFNGMVIIGTTGEPLAGVQVQVRALGLGQEKTLPNPTDATGHFGFDPAKLFDSWETNISDLNVVFTKDGVQNFAWVVLIKTRGLSHWDNKRVKMIPVSGSAALDETTKAKLNPVKSASGRTLYLTAYDFSLVEGGPSSERITKQLQSALHRVINTHFQTLNLPPMLFGLEALPVEVQWTNTERLRAYGVYLNALAIIGGAGHVEHKGGVVRVESQYLVIPWLEGLDSLLEVDDKLPLEGINSGKLSEHIRKLWGGYTVLALSIREFEQAREARDRAGLERSRTYVIAQRAQAGPDSEQLVLQLNTLLRMIEEDLAR